MGYGFSVDGCGVSLSQAEFRRKFYGDDARALEARLAIVDGI
jgi:hypothetical protein